MQIHLLRHGSAEHGGPESADSARRLTQAGREQLLRVLDRARMAKIAPSLIMASPKVRAVETARIAAEILGYGGALVQTEALVPNSSPQRVWEEVRSRQNEAQMLLVGHEPLLSQLAAYLLNTSMLWMEMRKAMLVRIDVDHFAGDPHGILRWMLPPEVMGG